MSRRRFAQLTAAVAIIVAVTVSSAPAFAQFYAGARGSAFLPNDRDDGLSDFDTGWGAEAFAGYSITPEFALEAGAGYYRTEWADEEDVLPESTTVSAIPVTLTAKGFVPVGERARLYAGGGIGAYFSKGEIEGSWKELGIEIDASDTSKDTAFGYHVIFGGEVSMTENLDLDVQVKWFRAEPGFSFFGDTPNETSVDADIGGVLLSVGLLFGL